MDHVVWYLARNQEFQHCDGREGGRLPVRCRMVRRPSAPHGGVMSIAAVGHSGSFHSLPKPFLFACLFCGMRAPFRIVVSNRRMTLSCTTCQDPFLAWLLTQQIIPQQGIRKLGELGLGPSEKKVAQVPGKFVCAPGVRMATA